MLILEVSDFKDPQHWRWVLKDESGRFLQDQEVCLDPADPNYVALQDLQTYLDSYSSPDKRVTDQLELLDEMSAWIGSQLLGKITDRLAQYRTPIMVRVLTPAEASGIAYFPLELARVGDRPLALQDISLVFETADSEPIEKETIGEKLRILAIFSLPTDVSALALRRERYTLMRLIGRIAQTHNLAIEMRVLQYGVTRDNLREALEEGDGWDMIHLSGHGKEATVILEKPDGTKDHVNSKDLADLLSLSRGKLKFVALSSCLSAAATLEESLKWLKLWKPEMAQETSSPVESDGDPMPALARQLVESTDCAVLAMRYTVGDEFAVTLAKELYERLLGKGQTLPRALQLSLRVALSGDHGAASPPLCIATPALFGRRAAELIIKPPRAQKGEFKMPKIGLAYFPPEPVRFVGRSGPLVRASSALAPDSDKRGVLFYGMAGAGKTACALELAYHHYRSRRFQGFVCYKAPDEGKDIDRAMLDLADAMEKQLNGFKMIYVVDDPEAFKKFLPILKQFLANNSILIVLDNLESLLTNQGNWRDERWKLLINALLEHNGYSRVILTSRRLPKNLVDEKLIVEPIHSLSLNEAVILSREMTNLGKMLTGRSTVTPEKGRELVTRTLELVQGHPKLIELADAQAADPAALEKYLDSAFEAWNEEKNLLDRFFLEGESARTAEEFLEVLSRWTQDVSRSLSPASRTLFQFLCALEDVDRLELIAKQVWPKLWKNLGFCEEAPGLEQTMSSIKSAALMDHRALGDEILYLIHPGVAQAILEELDDKFLAAVDVEMTAFLLSLFQAAWGGKVEGADEYIVMIGRRSVPYLIRQKMWSIASAILGQAIYRDSSPDLAASILPMLKYIAKNIRENDSKLLVSEHIAHALLNAGRWQESEETTRSLISRHLALGDLKGALRGSGCLFNLLYQTGRSEEALVLAEKMKGYVHQAKLGPWTQLMVEGERLQALSSKGEYDKILDTVADLREKMRHMPEASNQEEMVDTSAAKFAILDAGRTAAVLSRKNELGLELNTEIANIYRSKGATELELARHSFNGFYPLLYLERYDEAEKILISCRQLFERKRSIQELGSVFTALAELKARLGQIDLAIRFEEVSLRYSYLFGDPIKISSSHHNLALYMSLSKSKSSVDHELTAACISFQIYSGLLASSLERLALDLNRFGPDALPKTFDQLCDRVEKVDGVRFRELWTRLPKRTKDSDQLIKNIVDMAFHTEK